MGKRDDNKPGNVVWAYIPDRKGRNSKERPLLIIPPPQNAPGAVICCLAVSTEPEDDPADPAVEIPWNAVHGDMTGLYEFSRAVLLWHVQLDPFQITEHTGKVTKGILENITSLRQIALSFPVKATR
jgi:hypothetical protein